MRKIWKSLTRREVVVATAIMSGGTRTEIAERLEMSPRTFDTHRQNVLRKIGVRNEVGALLAALVDGVVRVEAPPPGMPGDVTRVVFTGMDWRADDEDDTVVADDGDLVCDMTGGGR